MYAVQCVNGNWLCWLGAHPRRMLGWNFRRRMLGWNFRWGNWGEDVIRFPSLIEAVDWIIGYDGPTCKAVPIPAGG